MEEENVVYEDIEVANRRARRNEEGRRGTRRDRRNEEERGGTRREPRAK
jgi:hypothetical protein